MNILVEQLPSAIEINGQEWPINTDFRECLRVIMAFEDVDLTTQEKQVVLLENLYPSLPSNVPEAFRLGIKFLNNGEEVEEATSESNPALRLYSFSQDANFIFSAFRQTHGIDLETAELHWWKFLALFMDLGADTTFCNLVSLRKRVKTGKASKEELRMYRDLKDVIDLSEPIVLTREEREQEDEFMRLVEAATAERERAKHAQSGSEDPE